MSEERNETTDDCVTAWKLVGAYVDSATSLLSLLLCCRDVHRVLTDDDSLWRGWYLELWGDVAEWEEDDLDRHLPSTPPSLVPSWRISYLRRMSYAIDRAIPVPNPKSPLAIYACLKDVITCQKAVTNSVYTQIDWDFPDSSVKPWRAERCPDWMGSLARSVYFWDASAWKTRQEGRRLTETTAADDEHHSYASEEEDSSDEADHCEVEEGGTRALGARLPHVGCSVYGPKRDPAVVIMKGFHVIDGAHSYDMYGSLHDVEYSISLTLQLPSGLSFKMISTELGFAKMDFETLNQERREMEGQLARLAGELGVPEDEDPRAILFLAFQGIPVPAVNWQDRENEVDEYLNPCFYGGPSDLFHLLVKAAQVEY